MNNDRPKRVGGGLRRKKACPFCADKNISERGKIMPKRMTGVCAMHQRALATEIKRARIVALLPFERD